LIGLLSTSQNITNQRGENDVRVKKAYNKNENGCGFQALNTGFGGHCFGQKAAGFDFLPADFGASQRNWAWRNLSSSGGGIYEIFHYYIFYSNCFFFEFEHILFSCK
jgi:hypothetical protein